MLHPSHTVLAANTVEDNRSQVRLSSPLRLEIRNFRQRLSRLLRMMAPALVALSFAGVSHAQGTMDFSGAQTLMGTFKTFAMYAGAVICLGGLIFAGIRMMTGRFQDAIPGSVRRVVRRRRSWLGCWLDWLSHRAVDVEAVMHTPKRGEPLPINPALNRPRAKLGLELSTWMVIVFVTGNGFPRWVPIAGDSQLPNTCSGRVVDRPQTPKDVPALGSRPRPEVLL